MRKLIALAAFSLLLGAGCSWFPAKTNPEPPSIVVPTQPVVPAQPTTTPQVFEDATKSIRVTNMASGQLLLNGSGVIGTANVFESQFSWRVEDANGRKIAGGNVKAYQPDMGVPGEFAFPVLFDAVPPTATGTLVLFDNSAKDGSEIDVVRIPVSFSSKTMTVNVYFGNTVMNPNAMDCSLVYPVTRSVPEGNVANAAVNALLRGPTAAEKKDGYYSSIPEGVVLQGLSDAKGNVSFDFNEAMQKDMGGSCRVTAIRSEIETTAFQGKTQEAIDAGVPFGISVDGRTEDILQP